MELFLSDSAVNSTIIIIITGIIVAILAELYFMRKSIIKNEYIQALGSLKNISKCKLDKRNKTAKVIVKDINLVEKNNLKCIFKKQSGNEFIFSYGDDKNLRKLFMRLKDLK